MSIEHNKLVDSADILVIGGGINGTGIARDAAGRGLEVVLCEKDDLAQHTSSSSTKLIHGGLRYLEHYDFLLVRHALQEREVLLKSAPHIIWPLRFLLPHHKALRPWWLIRLGLFLYDNIGGRKLLPRSRGVDLRKHIGGMALKTEFTRAFEYSDCWVQDARLVVLNARDAQNRGARILTGTKCTALERYSNYWLATLTDRRDGQVVNLRVRAVVNATGPWVEQTLQFDETVDSDAGVRLVKGSHIIVPKIFDHEYPYIFQNADGRVVFAIPFERDYTLLGTTDVEISGDPNDVSIDDTEVKYICDAINKYFQTPVDPEDRKIHKGPPSGTNSLYYLFAANNPRSVFLNRASCPFVVISRAMAAERVAAGVWPPGDFQDPLAAICARMRGPRTSTRARRTAILGAAVETGRGLAALRRASARTRRTRTMWCCWPACPHRTGSGTRATTARVCPTVWRRRRSPEWGTRRTRTGTGRVTRVRNPSSRWAPATPMGWGAAARSRPGPGPGAAR